MTAVAWLIEVVGIVAFATNVWANLLIARKSETGWIVRLVSNAFWLAFGIAALSLANILNAVTFAAINVYGLRRWRRERLEISRMQSNCGDHYKILCFYCRDVVRQCNCHVGTSKPTTQNGLCSVCLAQGVLPEHEREREASS
jgi:hypothetical protein